jgi:alpha-glucoside transport system substrate-binding protein
MRGSALFKLVVVVGATAMVTSGCLSSGSSSAGGGSTATAADNKTVTIWTSVDQPVLDGLKTDLDAKLQGTGITANWSKVENINQLIMTKIQANDVPDIALIPQPGVVADIVKRGKATPLDFLDMTTLKASMTPGTLESGTINGKLYGLLASMNVKSLVFYPKKAWDAAGYKAPTSIDELNALTDKIKAAGGTPWCMGIGSDAATGWPATDWFEDLIMRYGGVQGYNDWVSHKTKFDSPLVRQAAAEFEKIAFTPGNVLGGRKSISSTGFGVAGNPMFKAGKPGCWLLKQGSFITTFFPKPVQADLDNQVGLFGFPPATAGGDNPVLGGGDLAVLLKNTTSAQTVMKDLSLKEVGLTAAKTSTYLSPHKDFDVTVYPGKITQQVAKVAYSSSAFLFDGSDQMPGAVGAGTFWKDMTAWISGQEDLNTALKNIDASWPAS